MGEDLDFLGLHHWNNLATQVARGDMHPRTLQPFAQPQQTVTTTVQCLGLQCPSLKDHSREEVRCTIGWLLRLGEFSMSNLVNAINEGNRRGRMDACFVGLPDVPDHAYEYDGHYYHKEDRLPDDREKTYRMLNDDAELIVLRVRVDAPVLDIEHERLHVVYVEKPDEAVEALSQAFVRYVGNEAVRSRLQNGGDHRKDIDDNAHEFFMWADQEYKKQFKALEKYGCATAHRILCTDGVKTRLASGSIVQILDKLVEEPYNVKNLETFMCGGIAARFDKADEMFEVLDRLMKKPYNVKKLQTFMCGGIAAKFDKPDEMFEVLDKLMKEPYNVKELQTFMCNSIASWFDKDKKDKMFEILGKLKKKPYNVKSLESFMCDGIAARLDKEDFLTAYFKLQKPTQKNVQELCRQFPLK